MTLAAMLLEPAHRGEEDTHPLAEELGHAGLEVIRYADADSLLDALASAIAQARAPHAILLGDNLEKPLATARKIRALESEIQIVFLATAARADELKQRMSLAPLLGSHWLIAPVDSPGIANTITRTATAARQRRRLRTTLNRINLKLDSPTALAPSHLRRLLFSERQLAHILRHAQNAIVVMDERAVVQSWNLGAESIFNIPSDKAIGRAIRDLAASAWRDEIAELLERQRSTGGSVQADIRCGPGRHVSFSISSVLDEQGLPIALCVIAQDISERIRLEERQRQLNDSLSEANEALTQSNIELQQFAFIASHDLQTPLRQIIAYSKLLQERFQSREADAEAEELLARMVRGSEKMSSLVHDLLAYSRVESRSAPFARCALDEVFTQALELLEPSLAEARADVASDPLPVVMGDASQLTQLFTNLIGNGIKYHDDNAPVVRVSAAKQGKDWRISVQDNGIGVAPEHREKIFDIFHRLHDSNKYPGTGIGLAICRRIAERHGGKIWVDSVPRVGSVFHFTLPDSSNALA